MPWDNTWICAGTTPINVHGDDAGFIFSNNAGCYHSDHNSDPDMRTLHASILLNQGASWTSSIEASVTADIAYCNHALTRSPSSTAINSQSSHQSSQRPSATPVPQQPAVVDSGPTEVGTTEAGMGDGSGPGGSNRDDDVCGDDMEPLESWYLPLPGHDYPAGGKRRHDSSLPFLI